ncbi:MAG: DUF1080 domain-containing protein [Planctomycetes bacterium]|nr:DUF1080 domain-containing protein [Planctomycetota bacterium]
MPRFLVLAAVGALSVLPSLSDLAGVTAQAPTRRVWTDADAAWVEDPDFALQGEYASDDRGVQVVALGDGRFRVVEYVGGLPGLGWDREHRAAREVDTAALRSDLLPGLQRVARQSTTLGAPPPEGATVLFDGSEGSMANWQPGARRTADGLLEQGATSIATFGDARLHVEFRLPYVPAARGQARGNSGLYVQARYETQMLDSFGLDGKHNECGGIYSVRDPDLNMCLPPLTWQVYDIDFTAARFDADGNKTSNARMTVRLNGVVVHDDVEIPDRTTASPLSEGAAPGPIHLQDHGNPVRYRNVWVLPR